MKKYMLILLFLFFACDEEFSTLEVTGSSPSTSSMNIPEDAQITVTFNNKVTKEQFDTYFLLSSNSGNISGNSIQNSDKKYTFIPDNLLTSGTRYTVSIDRNIRDKNKNKMGEDFISEFIVGSDIVPPFVVDSTPSYSEGGTPNIAIDTVISIEFSEPMNTAETENAFSIKPSVTGYFSWNAANTVMFFTPIEDLDYGEQYLFYIDETAEDASGLPIKSEYSIYFITGSDFSTPVLTGMMDSTDINDAWDPAVINIQKRKDISFLFKFDKKMNTSDTEEAIRFSPSINGHFSWNANLMDCIFEPENELQPETFYSVNIDKTAKDIYGNKIRNDYYYLFKTDDFSSKYIQLGDIYGYKDFSLTVPDQLLFNGKPDMATYPYTIATDTGVGKYYIKLAISRIDNSGTAQNVDIDVSSLYDNITIKTFNDNYIGKISNIYYNSAGKYAIISIVEVSPSSDAEQITYRITIIGGTGGVKDQEGNYLKKNIVFDIQS